MREVEKFIFLFLVGTTLLNLIIAMSARVKTQNKEFNYLIFYWVIVFFGYLIAATLSHTPEEIAFASFFQVVPIFLLSKILCDSRSIDFRWKFYSLVFLAGAGISTYLIVFTDVGFTTSLLPVNLCTSLSLWEPSMNSLVTRRRDANWIEKAMSIVYLIGIVHYFDYAFFRLDDGAAWWGWSLSLGIYQCLSVFLILLINHRRDQKERVNLENTLNRISGLNFSYHIEIDEIYRQLDYHITLKEELTHKLQKANTQLQEEREMNEMLIKTISHDLANPLTVVNSYAEILHKGQIADEDKNDIWERLKVSTRSALDMIYRIRSAIITRNQANYIKIGKVSLDHAIRRVIFTSDALLKEKNIVVRYNNSDPEILVAADEESLIDHVLCNILSNAIKFSYEASEVQINVSDDKDCMQVEFKDFGCGIRPDRLKKTILHSTEGTKGEEGSGFGLMIMGYFVRKFGGTYQIHSQENSKFKGTTVTIVLPKFLTQAPQIDAPWSLNH